MEKTQEKFGFIRQGTVLLDCLHNTTLIVTAILDYYYCGNGKFILLQDKTNGGQRILEYERIHDRVLSGSWSIMSY